MNKYRERCSPLGLYWPRALLALAANNTMKCNSLFVAGICYSKIKKYKSTPCWLCRERCSPKGHYQPRALPTPEHYHKIFRYSLYFTEDCPNFTESCLIFKSVLFFTENCLISKFALFVTELCLIFKIVLLFSEFCPLFFSVIHSL